MGVAWGRGFSVTWMAVLGSQKYFQKLRSIQLVNSQAKAELKIKLN